MKYIHDSQPYNILTTDDITAFDDRSLSSVLKQQLLDINTLKSNLKWIYKYGGIGSGRGGGSEPLTSWRYLVELDGISRNNNDTINLGKVGNYKLNIRLFKILGRTFHVKIAYLTKNGTISITKSILPVDTPEISETIYLDINSVLSVTINDDEGEVATFNVDCIITAYTFNLLYVLGDGLIYIPQDGNIYVNDVKTQGLKVRLTYNISVGVLAGSYFTFTDWYNNSPSLPYNLVKGSHSIDLPLDINSGDIKYLTDSDAGFFNFIVEPHLILENTNLELSIDPLQLSDNVIPTNCYLKINTTTSGKLYLNEVNPETAVKFYQGPSTFTVTPFHGELRLQDRYSLDIYVAEIGEDFTESVSDSLTDRVPSNITLLFPAVKNYKVKFVLLRLGQTYEKIYYVYIKSATSDFHWYGAKYEGDITPTNQPTKSYLYVYGFDSHGDNAEILEDNKVLLQQFSQNSLDLEYKIQNVGNFSRDDYMLSFGIKYDNINNLTKPIITCISGNTKLQIYQNKILLNSETIQIYLPTQEYSLLTIYNRAIAYSSGMIKYECCVYINGVFEECFDNITESTHFWDTIRIHPCLCELNLIEISYFKHSSRVDADNTKVFYNYNEDGKLGRTYLTDADIIHYYYTYKLNFEPGAINQEFQDVYKFAEKLIVDHDTLRITVDMDTINKIASSTEVPVLLLDYTEKKQNSTNLPNGTIISTGNSFLSWMDKSYDVTSSPQDINKAYEVEVYYSPGKTSLDKPVDRDSNKCYFELMLQGTSTMLYTTKNFELILKTKEADEGEEQKICLYTPNFKKGDYDTFLPERSFTLKADVVDSSHSNNATIGKFVNTVCTKFASIQQDQSNPYTGYVKNTLQGFPILLFLKNSYYPYSNSEQPNSDYYFLGIYSFNLGRESEFNLGYKDLNLLLNSKNEELLTKDGKFDIIEVNASEYLDEFMVAEILENKTYFDFSLWDKTILFKLGDQDKEFMFSKFKNNSTYLYDAPLINLVKHIAITGGAIFSEKLEKNLLGYNCGFSPIDSLENTLLSYELGYKTDMTRVPPFNLVTNYRLLLVRELIGSSSNFKKSTLDFTNDFNNWETYAKLLLTIWLDDDGKNVNPVLDYKSLSEYYVICMALGLVDSVQKNLNVKKWKNTPFYIAFYDMDTSLGKDNAGNNTDPLAFSDYWKPQYTIEGSDYKLLLALSYKDWYDSHTPGFDTPSSYLFAVAKYARLLGLEGSNNIDSDFNKYDPRNIWARFRRRVPDSPEQATNWGIRNSQLGCLTNADEFIKNFYGGYLSQVPDIFFNYNYRKKYLMLKKNGEIYSYNITDKRKFSGKRIAYVRDWLNLRLHLLDLYFNLGDIADPILKCKITKYNEGEIIYELANYKQLDGIWVESSDTSATHFKLGEDFILANYKYVLDNNTYELISNLDSYVGNKYAKIDNTKHYPIEGLWETLTLNYPQINLEYVDSYNSDVEILQSAFFGTNQEKVSDNITAYITAPSYSPLIIVSDTTGRYIFPDTSKYLLDLNCAGKSVLLGGSVNWDSVSNINPFISAGGSLIINNQNFRKLVGTSEILLGIKPKACTNWTILAQSLEDVLLTHKEYSGRLSFSGKDGELGCICKNLKTVDVKNTKLSLTVTHSNVISINASNVCATAELDGLIIAECPNLQELSYSNSVFRNVDIKYPNNFNNGCISLAAAWEFQNGKLVDISNTTGNQNNLRCESLKVQYSSGNGKIVIDDYIKADDLDQTIHLKTITLRGFSEIYIKNCPYLESIIIEDLENVVIFDMIDCSSVSSVFKLSRVGADDLGNVYNDPDQEVHLENFNKLSYIYFRNCKGFNHLFLPNKYEIIDGKKQYTNEPTLILPYGCCSCSAKTIDGPLLFGNNSNYLFLTSGFTGLTKQGYLKLHNKELNTIDALKVDGIMTDFHFPEGNIMFEYLFYGASIMSMMNDKSLQNYFNAFNSKYKEHLHKITYVNDMWRTIFRYSKDDLILDLKNGTCSMSLADYTNAIGLPFGYTFCTAIHPLMFGKKGEKLFGMNAENPIINFKNGFYALYYTTGNHIYVPLNWLELISDRVGQFNICSGNIFHVLDENGNELTKPITLRDFFGKDPKELTIINGLNIDSKTPIIFDDPFNSTYFPKLQKIGSSFWNCKPQNINRMFTNTNITCGSSFSFSNDVSVDLSKFIDWDLFINEDGTVNINKPLNLFIDYLNIDTSRANNIFRFKKTIPDLDTFYKMLLIVLKCTNVPSGWTTPVKYPGSDLIEVKPNNTLAALFSNCIIESLGSTTKWYSKFIEYLDSSDNISKVIEINDLFANLLLKNGDLYVLFLWEWGMFKKLQNVVSCIGTFLNMYFKNFLPLNLFKTRYVTTEEIKLTPSDSNSSILYRYKYKTRINSLRECFKGCTFLIPWFESKIPKDKSTESIDYIETHDGKVIYSDSSPIYYINNNFDNPLTLRINTEWFNSNPTTYHYPNLLTEITLDANGSSAVNYTKIYNNYDSVEDNTIEFPKGNFYSILPMDLFYGCILSCDLSSCFEGCNLVGFIPDSLFSINCTSPNIKNFIRNAIVVPKLYKQDLFNLEHSAKFDLYYYIGHNFINTVNLDNAFNFRICLPYKNPILNTEYSKDGITVDHSYSERLLHVFCFTDSFKKLNSCKYMLPFIFNTNTQEVAQKTDERGLNILYAAKVFNVNETIPVSLNIMYNASGEKRENISDGTNTISIDILGELGVKSQFTDNYDKFITGIWLLFMYGNVFVTGTVLNKLNTSTTTNVWIMTNINNAQKLIDSWSSDVSSTNFDSRTQGYCYGISPEAIFPKLTNYKQYVIFLSGLSHWPKMGKNDSGYLIDNGADSTTIECYRQSTYRGNVSFP